MRASAFFRSAIMANTAHTGVSSILASMSDDEFLAYSQIWWAWDHAVIDKALSGGVLCTWPPILQAFLAGRSGRHSIESWLCSEAVRSLRRNTGNLRSIAQGMSAATDNFLLGLATLIGEEVGTLRPADTRDWVAQAAVFLPAVFASYRRRSGGRRFRCELSGVVERLQNKSASSLDWIPLNHARRYVDFWFACRPANGALLTCADVAERLAELDELERRPVRYVATKLAPALSYIDVRLSGQ